MSTADFIEDATDSLVKGEVPHIMICAREFGHTSCHFSANVPTQKHMDWFKRRFGDLCERLEAQYESD